MSIPLNAAGIAETVVNEKNTALFMKSGSLKVFATPALVALAEEAACRAVQPFLEAGQTTVGTRVELDHTAPSPIGQKVTAEACLVRTDRRKLVFSVSVRDEKQPIAEILHERFIVDKERFLQKAYGEQEPEV